MGSYYISTKRPEGVCSADVQVSLIVSLQESDVIVTLCLQKTGEKQVISGSTMSQAGEAHRRVEALRVQGPFYADI